MEIQCTLSANAQEKQKRKNKKKERNTYRKLVERRKSLFFDVHVQFAIIESLNRD